jgi:resuscitation-promoting factor RpfB
VLRSIKYGVNGAVLAGLIAAPVLWATVDKTVHLVVDGQGRTVQTTASDVAQVLDSHGYRLTSHDIVAPSAHSAVHDGARIVLRRGRLLHLNVDGRRTAVWTTAPTVSQALGQLGYTSSDFVSVSRSRRLPLGATSIAIRTPSTVSVVHDGRTVQVSTTDRTVGAVLADLGVRVGAQDRLSAPQGSVVHDDEVIRLQRVDRKIVSAAVKLPYATTRRADKSMTRGHTKVLTAGRPGSATVTYALVYVDGKIAGKEKLSTTTTKAPRARVLAVGTKKQPSAPNTPDAPAPSPGSAKAIAKQLLAQHGWGDDQYSCLVTMWNHESGWRVHASNGGSGAYGIPQALPGSKMASAGPDWQDNAETQIKWGLRYIESRYHDPCNAWATWQAHGGWYY